MSTSFNSKNVIVSFGPLPLLGLADGDAITVSQQGDGAATTVGAQGATVVVESNDVSAEVTVRFFATGDGRNSLAALVLHHEAGNPFLPIAIRSKDTGEAFFGGAAKVKRRPELSFGTTAPVREVVFVVPEPKMAVTADVG